MPTNCGIPGERWYWKDSGLDLTPEECQAVRDMDAAEAKARRFARLAEDVDYRIEEDWRAGLRRGDRDGYRAAMAKVWDARHFEAWRARYDLRSQIERHWWRYDDPAAQTVREGCGSLA